MFFALGKSSRAPSITTALRSLIKENQAMKWSARSKSVLTLVAAASLLLTYPPEAASAVDATTDAPHIDRPEIIRGFNTFGDRLTPQNADTVRNDYGANAVRLQIHPQQYAQQHSVSLEQAWDKSLDLTVQGLDEAARKGMMSIIDLHSVPIPANKNSPTFWADENSLVALVASWEEIVQRLAPYREYIWGYDLFNEAYNSAELPLGAADWPGWAQEITDAIRVTDQATPIIFEPSPGALPRGFKENEWIDAGPGYPVLYQGEFPLLDDDNVIYSFHWYELHAYTHQGIGYHNGSPVTEDWPDKMVYPGTNNGVTWNKETLRELMQPVVDIQEKYDVPIYVGEFSAVRWAPGASQYIRDSVELFEEFGWSWTYHSFRDWHGWQLDYTDTMTSDANSAAAIATQPTDRELTLKSHFARNQFVEPLDTPRPPTNLVNNGDFAMDADGDGLADGWSRGPNAQTSLTQSNGSSIQEVTVSTSNQKGVDQEWISVTPGNRYALKARLRVDQGQVRFWHYGVTSAYTFSASDIAAQVGPTSGAFVDSAVEFVAASNTARLSIRFWANAAAKFGVTDVELIDLGPAVVVEPPRTEVAVTTAPLPDPTLLQFTATAAPGKSIDRTEYRIVGESQDWAPVPTGGLPLTESGSYILGYRSVDSAGVVEQGRAIAVTVPPITDTTIPQATLVSPTISGPFQSLSVLVEATDNLGLGRIVADIYQGATLIESTASPANGAMSASHSALLDLTDGSYSISYSAEDVAGNSSQHATFNVTIDTTAPIVTVKEGSSYTVGSDGTYSRVSFKLHDLGRIDKVTINGVVKDLTNNAWSDVNYVKPGTFGAVAGNNTLVVYDEAGNTTTFGFVLTS
ncbi:cellulase family glycosylhydrolase [Arthrobacter sp. CJ23]|uniref:cellulase family glycosylhydrolase n=1 Tax=Arthrobacter sp. CJ23 TaxID=2972479 RepID=UPI00215D4901|nr:cellulase family glycosylhydrolase [Arthrobacter sp. CJ23]UVJ39226.1 cellulase family glycosylhydrolase [Arthrobacter sp. CJ23]